MFVHKPRVIKCFLPVVAAVFILTACSLSVVAAGAADSAYRAILKLPDNRKKTDTLLHLIPLTKDTGKVSLLYKEVIRVATNLNDQRSIMAAYDEMGVIKRNLSDYITALSYHRKALDLAEKTSDYKMKMQVLNNIGVVYRRMDESNFALDYHMKALKMAEAINDTRNICISINSIGNIYLSLGQSKSALPLFKRALQLEKSRGNEWGIAINLNNIGAVYEENKNLDSALFYYKQSLYYDEKIGKKAGIAICYNSIGEIYLKKEDYGKAVYYFDLALKINQIIGDKIYISVSYTNIANAFLLKKDYSQAIVYFNKALAISLAIGSKSQSQVAFEGLSKCYQQMNMYNKALEYYKTSVLYNDSVVNEDNVRHITLIQAQYNSEKQQQQIMLLKKEKEASRLYGILSTILVLAIIVFSLFGYRNIRQKRKIAKQELDLKEQKIRELEKEHQLIATQLVLQGEETERSRLARDLHDGLGGLLSGVKLSLSKMKGNIIWSSDHLNDFNKALVLLDSSIGELRRVAHNMMPETLVKFGLKDAISDFCSSIDSRSIELNFQFYGKETRVDNKVEISVYRIAQELINNAMKYSGATHLIVQLVQEDKRVNLTVQDNGKGFNTDLLQTSKGAGIANIRSRVESLNGRFDIFSAKGKGTEATVEFC